MKRDMRAVVRSGDAQSSIFTAERDRMLLELLPSAFSIAVMLGMEAWQSLTASLVSILGIEN